MSKSFYSIYAESLRAYIHMKQQFGFAYKTGVVILAQLDRLAAKRGESTPGISPALAEAWVARRPDESEHSHYQRVRLLIGFSSYLVDLGTDSFIPKPPAYPSPTFIPYIYSSQQMQALFQACDQLRLCLLDTDSSLLSMPTLIRLLYATGIRIGEALNLKNQDVNLKEGYLRVKDSKNGKERLIPISASLVSVCKQYVDYRNHLPLEKIPTYFFIKLNGRKCSGHSIRHWFSECLRQVGIPYTARVHDLRHTFAVTSLATMAEAGVDLYVSLPILSHYLGHQSLESTNHYVRLTAQMYPDLIRNIDMICLDVFPKHCPYEAD